MDFKLNIENIACQFVLKTILCNKLNKQVTPLQNYPKMRLIYTYFLKSILTQVYINK